jgi:hypothetical protein
MILNQDSLKIMKMKQKLPILSSFILVLFVVSSCIFSGPSIKGNGNIKEETRNTGDFTEIKVSRGMNVYISQGEQTKVVVRADENLLDAIETDVKGDALNITVTKFIRNASTMKVFVTTPKLVAIKSSSGSNAFSETVLKGKEMKLSASAGSNIKLEINAGNTEVSASSGSNITLEGTTGSFTGKASAGSNIKAERLVSKKCEARVSSGANIWITANGDFSGRASSGGNVFYYGNPESTNIEKSSGGNVIKN